jgi:hypothetical protein
MEIKDFIEIAKEQRSVLSGAPYLVLAIVAITASVTWFLKGQIDDGKVEGLKCSARCSKNAP